MPATVEGSAGTDKYASFEEKRWPVRVVSCKETTSPSPDNRPQYEWHMAVEGAKDYDTGAELVRRMWCSTTWGEIPEKESHLVIIARALCGPGITREQFEALDFPDLVGLRATAMVTLDPKGWPTIDKTTFRPVGNSAPKNQAALPQTAAPATAAAPAQAQLPNKPTRPNFKPRAEIGLRTEDQAAEILQLARASEPPLTDEQVNEWIASEYPGQTLATINAEQGQALIAAFGIPF